MPIYCKNKTDVVQCANVCLNRLAESGLPWTMTIKPDIYEGYSVSAAISSLSDDTVEKLRTFLTQPSNISQPNTPAG